MSMSAVAMILAISGALAAGLVAGAIVVIVVAWFLLGPSRSRDKRNRPSPPTGP